VWLKTGSCCSCVVSQPRFSYSGPYFLICGPFLKNLGVWSTYMSCVLYNQIRFDNSALLRKNFSFFWKSLVLPKNKSESTKQLQYDVSQCFPIFFWLAPPFLTKKFLSPPYLAHISTQFFCIVYLVCLKMIKTTMSAKKHFTIKFNLVN